MRLINCSLLVFLCFSFSNLFANATDSLQVEETYTEEEMMAMYQAYIDSLENTFTYEYNSITIGDDLATIQVPKGYKYLNGADSDRVITDVWGNPPREGDNRSLGMLIPEKDSPMMDSSFAINITYTEDGYVDDADAKNIDYDEMLESMRADSELANEYRIEEGYPPVNLVGWASQPYYDASNKKLHWAKELNFGDSPENTLNYNIRVLGRKGYLQMNVIGEMYVFDKVKENIDPVISSVNFNQGQRYADFNPDMDKVAAYGVGALIAGKVMAKAGLFAKVGIILAKFWKVIALAIFGFFAGVRKMFGGGENV